MQFRQNIILTIISNWLVNRQLDDKDFSVFYMSFESLYMTTRYVHFAIMHDSFN